MLGFFRSHYAFNHLFLLLYIILIRHVSLFDPQAFSGTSTTWFYQFILQLIQGLYFQNILAIILLWVHSILINTMINNHKMSRENSLFPGLFYVLLMSLLKEGLSLHPILITNTFLILGVYNIIESTKHVDIRHFLFNAGFFLTLSAIIYPPYILLIIPGIIGFYSIKSLKPIGNIQFFAGAVTSLLLTFGIQYLMIDNLIFDATFQWINLALFTKVITLQEIIYAGLQLLMLGYLLILYPDLIAKKNIQTRKKIEFFYLHMAFLFVGALVFFHYEKWEMMTLALPLGILFGIRIAEYKSLTIAEVIHLLIVGSLIFIQYST